MHAVRELCVLVKADRVVPDDEADDRHQGVPGELRYNLGGDKSCPIIRTALALSRLVQRALHDEDGNDLEDKVDDNKEKNKNTKELILKALLCVRALEEGESDEEGLCFVSKAQL